MITKTQVMESLIGKPVVDAVIETLYNQDDSVWDDRPVKNELYGI